MWQRESNKYFDCPATHGRMIAAARGATLRTVYGRPRGASATERTLFRQKRESLEAWGPVARDVATARRGKLAHRQWHVLSGVSKKGMGSYIKRLDFHLYSG